MALRRSSSVTTPDGNDWRKLLAVETATSACAASRMMATVRSPSCSTLIGCASLAIGVGGHLVAVDDRLPVDDVRYCDGEMNHVRVPSIRVSSRLR